MEAVPGRDSVPRVPSARLLREPLSWAGVAAILGAVVGLAGTFSTAAFFGDLTAGATYPPPGWLAAPLGQSLAIASLPGVLALAGRTIPRRGTRIARICGISLVGLFLAIQAAIVVVGLGWISFGDGGAGGRPPVFIVVYLAGLVLPGVIPLPFALVALLGRERRVGALLVGLAAFGIPFLLVWQTLLGGIFGQLPEQITALMLLGGLGVGVSLLAAPLWVLLGVVLLRRSRERALGKAFRSQEKGNLQAARRLYEEGLARGDASILDDLVSEDFRDPRSGARGRLAMERVFAALWKSYPDLSVEIDEQEAGNDTVRTRLLLSGTDEGGVLWYPPTNRRASFAAEFTDRFSDGRLVEHSGETDTGDLLRQLGLEVER